MAGAAETLSFVSRRLIQFEKKFANADLELRKKSAKLFLQIGSSLSLLLSELERDHLPHEPARELILYSTLLEELTNEPLGAEEASRLGNAMRNASDKEKLYLEYRASNQKKHLSEELEKASILIRALANGIYMEMDSRPS